LKISYVITGLDRGGAEIQVRDLALSFKLRGHSVEIVSLLEPKAFTVELEDAGISIVCLNMHRERKKSGTFVRAAMGLRRHIRLSRPDIVHSHMVHANILARLALAWKSMVPLICTAHSITEGGAVRDWAYRLTNWASTLDTTVSHAATNRFLADKVFKQNKTVTVYNGIDHNRYSPRTFSQNISGQEFRWVAVGRLHEAKDYPTLLNAMARCAGATLDIAGHGDLYEPLAQQVHRLGLNDRVRFLGLRDDVPDLLPAYDGFVLSSAWEGFGLVVAEAMASAIPVVATRSGGPQEIVGEDETAGFLVPPRRSDALAAAMQRLMKLTPEQRQNMGMAGRNRVQAHFSLNAAVSRWEQIYRDLMLGKAVSQ